MTYKHACDMLRKHGNAKIGNAFEIKREDIRPVALEVAFEDPRKLVANLLLKNR
ncbi:hypothetical protein NIB75_02855 [Bacteroides uniformis]|nr:hypothetical protein [Bacteroides uniformis]